MHVVYTLANNDTADYYTNYFAEQSRGDPGIKTSFVCMYPVQPRMVADIERRGSDCYWVPYNAARRKSELPKAAYRLYRLFRRLKPDIVHTVLFDDSLAALFAARLARVPTRIISKCDAGFHYYFKKRWVAADRFNNWNATHVLAISEENRRIVAETERPDERKLVVMPSGVSVRNVTEHRPSCEAHLLERLGVEPGKRVVLKVARFVEWKGHSYVLEAVPRVLARHPDVHFLFLGAGPLEQEVTRIVRERGLEGCVTLGGVVGREELNCLYNRSAALVHAAYLEPFGGVIAEAMLNRTPVVCAPSGIAADYITHRENGLLAKAKDPGSLADCINYVLDDPPRAAALGERGRSTIMQHFTIEKVWARLRGFYRSTVEARS